MAAMTSPRLIFFCYIGRSIRHVCNVLYSFNNNMKIHESSFKVVDLMHKILLYFVQTTTGTEAVLCLAFSVI